MSLYRRSRVPGGCYFFTVNLLERKSRLLAERVADLRAVVQDVQTAWPFHVDAWVVLPDHMHCVWTLNQEDSTYALRWRLIKAGFSKRIARGESLSDVRMRRRERGIWQRRYWEHTIRDDADYAAHIDYVHFNPVKHGLVEHPGAWPLSTFGRCVREGLYPSDWDGGSLDVGAFGERSGAF